MSQFTFSVTALPLANEYLVAKEAHWVQECDLHSFQPTELAKAFYSGYGPLFPEYSCKPSFQEIHHAMAFAVRRYGYDPGRTFADGFRLVVGEEKGIFGMWIFSVLPGGDGVSAGGA